MIPASQTLTDILKEQLHQHEGWLKGLPMLIACSGGSDSVALAAAAANLQLPFALAHVNYRLRGKDSTLDQELVEALGKEWKVPVHTWTVPDRQWFHGESLQQKAREIRYEFFNNLMEEHGYHLCLLAHHQDDQAESILLSLVKGNAYRVFSPIPQEREGFFRPFLTTSKDTCRKALQEWKISWREDRSNASNDYQRNLIRNEVFPKLTQINSRITQQLTSRANWYEQQIALLQELLKPWMETLIRYRNDVHTFSWAALPDSLGPHQRMIFASVLSDWGWHGFHLLEALDLMDSIPGRHHQWEGHLVKGRDLIQWIPPLPDTDDIVIADPEQLPASGSIAGREWSVHKTPVPPVFPGDGLQHIISLDHLIWPLTIKQPEAGQKMTPLGMQGSQLLSDIMINAKFRPAQKAKAILLTDADQHVLCLSDFRIAEQAKIREPSTGALSFVIQAAD